MKWAPYPCAWFYIRIFLVWELKLACLFFCHLGKLWLNNVFIWCALISCLFVLWQNKLSPFDTLFIQKMISDCKFSLYVLSESLFFFWRILYFLEGFLILHYTYYFNSMKSLFWIKQLSLCLNISWKKAFMWQFGGQLCFLPKLFLIQFLLIIIYSIFSW